jgi:hypothetical protein
MNYRNERKILLFIFEVNPNISESSIIGRIFVNSENIKKTLKANDCMTFYGSVTRVSAKINILAKIRKSLIRFETTDPPKRLF